eukprot:1017664-Prymnesium_polylepis.1
MLHLDARTCGDDPRDEHRRSRGRAQLASTHMRAPTIGGRCAMTRASRDAPLKRAMAVGGKQRSKKRRTFSF